MALSRNAHLAMAGEETDVVHRTRRLMRRGLTASDASEAAWKTGRPGWHPSHIDADRIGVRALGHLHGWSAVQVTKWQLRGH